MAAAPSQQAFLERLQAEAALQARLHHQRVLPTQVDWLTSRVGRYPWQVFLILALITSMVLEIIKF